MQVLEKTCLGCSEAKPLSEFWRCAQKPDGYRARCKTCSAARRYISQSPEAQKLRHLSRAYGLTPIQYQALVDESQGRCMACHRERPLCVDHCHKTGRVRGLLCGNCNTALGLIREDVAMLTRYLDER